MSEQQWLHPDRRDLRRATSVLIGETRDTALLGYAVDILLNDLKIYDSPKRKAGRWLFPDELPLLESFAMMLKTVLAESVPILSGQAILSHPKVEDLRYAGQELLAAMARND
jgi:hypothetical protein